MSAIKYQTFSLSKARDLVKYGWYMEAEEAHVQTYPDLLIPDACPEFIFVLEGAYEKLALQAPHSLQVIAASTLLDYLLNPSSYAAGEGFDYWA